MTLTDIQTKIENYLNLPGTRYINCNDQKGETIKIRVSDHSAKKWNNGDTKTLSFVSARCNQGYQAMTNEWLVLENGLTDTYEEISDILENEGVVC